MEDKRMGSVCGRTDDVIPTDMGGIITDTRQESKGKNSPANRKSVLNLSAQDIATG